MITLFSQFLYIMQDFTAFTYLKMGLLIYFVFVVISKDMKVTFP